ncbi:MAG: tetratricopeptide repeat protein [Rhodothermaceae bacterium]
MLFILSGVSILRIGRKEKNFDPFYIIKTRLIFFLSLVLLPLIISLFNTLVLSICPFKGGIEFYLIDTIPAAFIGMVLAAISLKISFRYSYFIFAAIFACFVLTPILEIYFYHQMFFYNPLIGFFPGTIYDENISMHSKHFLYQLFSVKITFLAYILLIKKEKRYKIYLPIFIAYFLGVSFLKPMMSFATNQSKIEKILPGKYLSEHFEIIYPGGISDKKIKTIAAEHEFYFQKIKSQLGFEPEGKITSILFENREQKGKVFGAKNADVAKLWMNTIYLQIGEYANTLEHEMAHVFSREIGSTPFKVAAGFNFSLIEGFAMAVEDEYGGKEVHNFAALAYKNNFKVLPADLFGGLSFFGNVSGLSYVTAGSFIKFLNDKYSPEQVNKVYGDGDFEEHFGKPIEVLSEKYEKFISSYPVTENSHTSMLYFGRKPLIKRFCPRYIAGQRAKAEQFMSKKMYKNAETIYREIFDKTNQYFALSGIVNCLRNSGKAEEALEFAEKESGNYSGTAYKYSYNITLADLYILNKKYAKADSLYNVLADEKPTDFYFCYAKTRKAVLAEPDSVTTKYINGSRFDRYLILKELNKEDPADFMLPSLVSLSESLNENYGSFIKSVKHNLKIVSEETSFAAYQLSEYAKNSSEFNDAIRFAKAAIKSCNDKSRLPVLKENLEKLEWMKVYCD